MEKQHSSKLILLAVLFLTSCTKELSHEKGCGTVYKIDTKHVYIAYSDGSLAMVKQDSSYHLNQRICK